jgi:hypothetical protein
LDPTSPSPNPWHPGANTKKFTEGKIEQLRFLLEAIKKLGEAKRRWWRKRRQFILLSLTLSMLTTLNYQKLKAPGYAQSYKKCSEILFPDPSKARGRKSTRFIIHAIVLFPHRIHQVWHGVSVCVWTRMRKKDEECLKIRQQIRIAPFS